jgi:hypothetical protein
MSKPTAYWRTTSRTAGSICQEHVPQIAGAPEGCEGAFRGLVLHTDASDRTWRLMSGRSRIVRRGTAGDPTPTPLQALQMARPAAARRLAS